MTGEPLKFASNLHAATSVLGSLRSGWTDFNAHDPGVTILEQLCYVLTDLSYRCGYELPDLLSDGGSDPYESLPPPAEILTTRPVTLADLRRLVLDVRGVKNAWVDECVIGLPQNGPRVFAAGGEGGPLKIRGLLRVIVEPEMNEAWSGLAARVARCLHANRGLCEDFAEVVQVTSHGYGVDVTVEVGRVEDPVALAREIVGKLAYVISPTVNFQTFEEVRAGEQGRPIDACFEGPRLAHGFLPDEALARAIKRTEIHVSDLIHAIMDVEGVRVVTKIGLTEGDKRTPRGRSVSVENASDPGRNVVAMNFEASSLTLRRAGRDVRTWTTLDEFVVDSSAKRQRGAGAPVLPVGRDRGVSKYTSVQQHMPALYGVGETGLSDTATPERRAQAMQLRAYLMFFDQLMANFLAQLGHVKDLFSFDDPGEETYFSQMLDQPGMGFEALLVDHRSGPAEEDDSRRGLERGRRFLSHLLARFGESLFDLEPGHEELTQTRLVQLRRLLRRYPRVSSARGTGFNYLERGAEPSMSGLEERLRLRLGLKDGAIIVVEHILLRPLGEDEEGPGVVLTLPGDRAGDPYSLKLSIVIRKDDTHRERMSEIEVIVREDTPAHLQLVGRQAGCAVHWMEANWDEFVSSHRDWSRRLSEYHRTKLDVEGKAVTSRRLRSSRNRVVDLLGIGVTKPFTDLRISVVHQGGPAQEIGDRDVVITDGEPVTIVVHEVEEKVDYFVHTRSLSDADVRVLRVSTGDLRSEPHTILGRSRFPEGWWRDCDSRRTLAELDRSSKEFPGYRRYTDGRMENAMFALDASGEDRVVFVGAKRDFSDVTREVRLEQVKFILARPRGTLPKLKIFVLADGKVYLAAAEGIAGVRYDLYVHDSEQRLGRLYFHWKDPLRKGIGTKNKLGLEVSRDFVVRNAPPVAGPLAAFLRHDVVWIELGDVIPGGVDRHANRVNLDVMAYKVRTGVSWAERQSVVVEVARS